MLFRSMGVLFRGYGHCIRGYGGFILVVWPFHWWGWLFYLEGIVVLFRSMEFNMGVWFYLGGMAIGDCGSCIFGRVAY